MFEQFLTMYTLPVCVYCVINGNFNHHYVSSSLQVFNTWACVFNELRNFARYWGIAQWLMRRDRYIMSKFFFITCPLQRCKVAGSSH